MSEVEFFVKLRDACAMIADAANEYLERNPPVKGSTRLPYDLDKITWKDRENEKGPFQASEDYMNPDHKALVAFLIEHTPSHCVNSKDAQGRTWLIWLYSNENTIGRRLKKP